MVQYLELTVSRGPEGARKGNRCWNPKRMVGGEGWSAIGKNEDGKTKTLNSLSSELPISYRTSHCPKAEASVF